MMIHTQALSRRCFLLSSGAAGIAISFGAFDGILPAGAAPPFKPNAWVFINEDDTVTIMSPAVEMGQGIMTALPACLAEDLDVDWAKVRVETAPPDESLYGNAKLGNHMLTVASKSIDGFYEKMRL